MKVSKMNKKTINKNITIEQFIEEMTNLREQGGEYVFQGTVNKKLVTLNGIGTHNKFFIINGTKHGGLLDLSVEEWIHELRRAVTNR